MNGNGMYCTFQFSQVHLKSRICDDHKPWKNYTKWLLGDANLCRNCSLKLKLHRNYRNLNIAQSVNVWCSIIHQRKTLWRTNLICLAVATCSEMSHTISIHPHDTFVLTPETITRENKWRPLHLRADTIKRLWPQSHLLLAICEDYVYIEVHTVCVQQWLT